MAKVRAALVHAVVHYWRKAAEATARSIVAMLASRGWKPSWLRDAKEEEYRSDVPTQYGPLRYVSVGSSPFGAHVRCLVHDVDRARAGGAYTEQPNRTPSFNPHSGKWTFEFFGESPGYCVEKASYALDRVGAP